MDEEQDAPSDDAIEARLEQDPNDICSTNRLKMNITLPTAKVLLEDEPDIEIAVIGE
jgi:hypothetical protein